MPVLLRKVTPPDPRPRSGELGVLVPPASEWKMREAGDHPLALAAHARATGYAWGRQDAGESPMDTDMGTRFADAYAEHVRRFVAGQHWTQANVARAYDQWSNGQEIA